MPTSRKHPSCLYPGCGAGQRPGGSPLRAPMEGDVRGSPRKAATEGLFSESVAGSLVSLVHFCHRRTEQLGFQVTGEVAAKPQSRGVPLVPRGGVGGRCRQCSWVSLQSRVGNCARLRMEWLGCFQPLPQVKSWGSTSLSVLCLAKTPAPPSWVIFRNRNQFFSGLDLSPSKIGSSPTQHKFLFWGKSKTLVCVCLGKTRGERSWERRFWSQVRTGLLHYFHF